MDRSRRSTTQKSDQREVVEDHQQIEGGHEDKGRRENGSAQQGKVEDNEWAMGVEI